MTEPVSWADLVKDAGEVGSFEPVPDGDYDLVVTEATFKPTKTGKRMYSTKSRIEGGPHNGRYVWDNLVVTPDSPGALMYFFRKMQALGLPREFFQSNPADSVICERIKGARYRATLGKRTYNGNTNNEIKTYHSPQGAGLAPSVGGGQAPPPPAAAPAPAPAPAPAAAPAPAPQAAPAPAPAAPPAAPAPQAQQPLVDPWAPTPAPAPVAGDPWANTQPAAAPQYAPAGAPAPGTPPPPPF